MVRIVGTLGKYDQRKVCEIVNPFDLLFLLSQKSKLSLENKNLRWGGISLWNKKKILIHIGHNYCYPYKFLWVNYRKYIPIHIHNFEHTSGIMNMKLSSHGFLFHKNINRRENKGHIPNESSITMRKNKEYMSDVQLKIIELHKLESGFKKRARGVKMTISTIRAIIKNFQSTENVMSLPGRRRVSISS